MGHSWHDIRVKVDALFERLNGDGSQEERKKILQEVRDLLSIQIRLPEVRPGEDYPLINNYLPEGFNLEEFRERETRFNCAWRATFDDEPPTLF